MRLLFASVSFPLRDASRPRVNFRLWTLCLLFPFTQFCAEPNLGKQLRCHHMFIYVCMSIHICHVYMLSLACWNFTYQELSGGWVGSSLTFCHAVFISHPTRSMHSFPPWEGIFEITKHNAVNFSFVNECNSMMLQCSNNHTMLNQRSFPFLRKTEKCVPGLSFQLHIQFEHVARKFANKLFDGFTCLRCLYMFVTRGAMRCRC